MKDTLKEFGWVIKSYQHKYIGTPVDVYAELKINGLKYFMLIDDGNISMYNTIYRIYAETINNKIFEGRITTVNDFEFIMKILGLP